MAIKTLTFQTDGMTIVDVDTAVAAAFHYQDIIPDPVTNLPIANPETKSQFVRRIKLEEFKEQVKTGLLIVALAATTSSVISSLNPIT